MESLFTGSPLQLLEDDVLNRMGVTVYVKRDDLIHPQVQGNKWRKLKYNIAEAQRLGKRTLLSFGGTYSNHIYALAAAASYFNLNPIGVIRGEQPSKLSATLQFAIEQGMKLHFVSRGDYKYKDDPTFIEGLYEKFGDFYLVSEGGTNALALKGVAEIVNEISPQFDYLCSACGTGGTIAGLVAGLKGERQVLGFSALKGEDALTQRVNQLTRSYCGREYANFNIYFNYHFGGYAKVNRELIDFIKQFRQRFDIPLEPVYTGKMFYGLFDLIKKGYFARGTRIVALHTGGLQGLRGYAEYFE